MSDVDMPYIAGLFDGEGSVEITYPKATKSGKRYAKLRARIASTDRDVLEWVKVVMNAGTIHRKGYPKEEHHLQGWDFVVSAAAARRFLTLILPYLHTKRAKVKKLLQEDAEKVKPNAV